MRSFPFLFPLFLRLSDTQIRAENMKNKKSKITQQMQEN